MSIYLDPVDTKKMGPAELVQAYSSELATCKRLLSMGFTHSNLVGLVTRSKFLSREVKRCEDIVRELNKHKRH